jgi:hypothetical protein
MASELINHNIRLLERQITEAGFPDTVFPELRNHIQAGNEPAIFIPFSTSLEGNDVTGNLYFERQADKQTYSLNYLMLKLGNESKAVWKGNIFTIDADNKTSLKEAYNLMHGRSVYREPSVDPAGKGYWIKLGAREDIWGFADLDYIRNDFRAEKAVEKSIISGLLSLSEKKALAESLKQGNRQEVEVISSKVPLKLYVTAHPAAERLLILDAQKRLFTLKRLVARQESSEDQKKSQHPSLWKR